MDRTALKDRLHDLIDMADDRHLEAIYTLLEMNLDKDNKRRELIRAERASYLQGIGKSYSVADVKAMALNKSLRSGL